MITYFRKRALVAGVAAEIKAQCKDQELVRQVCFTTIGMHVILDLGEERFPQGEESRYFRYFMIATFLLAETIRTYDIPLAIKTACLELLHERRAKIEYQMAGGYVSGALKQKDVDDLDKIIDLGIRLLHTERREAAARHVEAETGMDLSWMRRPNGDG